MGRLAGHRGEDVELDAMLLQEPEGTVHLVERGASPGVVAVMVMNL